MATPPIRRAAQRALLVTTTTLGLGLTVGCLTTPVGTVQPDTKANFTATIRQQQVDRVDLLFAIDNSASMGDKQEILAEAIPDLLTRLLVPNCVDPQDENVVVGQSQNGQCANGKIEFKPIRDLHVGIVSSSLGTPGSETCPDRMNDRARLLNRSYQGDVPVRSAGESNFLAWYPPAAGDGEDTRGEPAPNALADAQKLTADFQELVRGVKELGCGYEAQLESVYRFLVQPDPYESVEIQGDRAKLTGVDDEILRQRHDFLRPDSLVSIILVTDENESTADPRALGGQGFKFMNQKYSPPKANQVCSRTPAAAECGPTQDPDADDPQKHFNVRFFQPKRRFGVDPFYPMERYVNGFGFDGNGRPLQAPRVPNREQEHPNGGAYKVEGSCTNPLFAAELPVASNQELCKLPLGGRDPSMVFFAAITGVPHQLLHFDPSNAEKSRLTDGDWVKILGRDPLKYDFSGQDPHMRESTDARVELAQKTNDPVHGREWETGGNDLQYACTFDLKKSKPCTNDNNDLCDCKKDSDSPVCDPSDRGQNVRQQVRAKAYPGIRHLALARALGDNGIVSSICPMDVRDASPTNLRYGYRPAVKVIVDRLKTALATQCLPRRLTPFSDGKTPCLLLEMLAKPGPQSQCDNKAAGLKRPDEAVLRRFLQDQKEQYGDGFDPSKYPICELAELDVKEGSTCVQDGRAGWCYVQGDSARSATQNRCSNAVLFSEKGNPKSGAKIFLQCIEKI